MSQSFRMHFCPADCLAGHMVPYQDRLRWNESWARRSAGSDPSRWCVGEWIESRHQGISFIIPCDNHIYDKSRTQGRNNNPGEGEWMSVSVDPHYVAPHARVKAVCLCCLALLETVHSGSLWDSGVLGAESTVLMPKSCYSNPSALSHLTDKEPNLQGGQERDLQRQGLSCCSFTILNIPGMCMDMCRQTKPWGSHPSFPWLRRTHMKYAL